MNKELAKESGEKFYLKKTTRNEINSSIHLFIIAIIRAIA